MAKARVYVDPSANFQCPELKTIKLDSMMSFVCVRVCVCAQSTDIADKHLVWCLFWTILAQVTIMVQSR